MKIILGYKMGGNEVVIIARIIEGSLAIKYVIIAV
jgi:hypothetical protein